MWAAFSLLLLLCRFCRDQLISQIIAYSHNANKDDASDAETDSKSGLSRRTADLPALSSHDNDLSQPSTEGRARPSKRKRNGVNPTAVLNADFKGDRLFGVPHIKYHAATPDWFDQINSTVNCMADGGIPVRHSSFSGSVGQMATGLSAFTGASLKREPEEGDSHDTKVKFEAVVRNGTLEDLPVNDLGAVDSPSDCLPLADVVSDGASATGEAVMDVEDSEVGDLTSQVISIPVRRPSGSLLASLRTPSADMLDTRPSSTEAMATGEELTTDPTPTHSVEGVVSPDPENSSPVEEDVKVAKAKKGRPAKRGRPKKDTAAVDWEQVCKARVEKYSLAMYTPNTVSPSQLVFECSAYVCVIAGYGLVFIIGFSHFLISMRLLPWHLLFC